MDLGEQRLAAQHLRVVGAAAAVEKAAVMAVVAAVAVVAEKVEMKVDALLQAVETQIEEMVEMVEPEQHPVAVLMVQIALML